MEYMQDKFERMEMIFFNLCKNWAIKTSTSTASLTGFASWLRTASIMGIIMAVVAVLLIHMDRNHVTNMKPNISLKEMTPMLM